MKATARPFPWEVPGWLASSRAREDERLVESEPAASAATPAPVAAEAAPPDAAGADEVEAGGPATEEVVAGAAEEGPLAVELGAEFEGPVLLTVAEDSPPEGGGGEQGCQQSRRKGVALHRALQLGQIAAWMPGHGGCRIRVIS